jgi:hypothetical protein
LRKDRSLSPEGQNQPEYYQFQEKSRLIKGIGATAAACQFFEKSA